MSSITRVSRMSRGAAASFVLASTLLATTARAAEPAAASALTSPPQATLLEILPPSIPLAASIVAANPQATTYALSCAPPASDPVCKQIAGLVMTQGPSTIAIVVTKTVDIASLAAVATAPPKGLDDILLGGGEQPAAGSGSAPVQLAVNCDLQGSGATICTKKYIGLAGLAVPVEIASQVKQLEVPVAVTLAPGEVKFLPVAVTAGVEKLGAGPAETPSSAGNPAPAVPTPPAAVVPSATASPATTSSAPPAAAPPPPPTTSSSIPSAKPAAAPPLANASIPPPAPPAAPAVVSSTVVIPSTMRSKVTSTAWIVPTGEAGVRSSNQTKTTSTSNSTTGAGAVLDTSLHLNFIGFVLTSFVVLAGW